MNLLWRGTKNMVFIFLITFLLFSLPPLSSSSQNLVNNIITHRKIFPKQQNVTSYAVIFDAGSSGSRVHVFQFDRNLNLLHINGSKYEYIEKTKPDLSSFETPEEAAKSLIPLLKHAEQLVPKDLRPNTPLKLGATAGLRLLNETEANKILQAVKEMFKKRSALDVQAVEVIDGTEEGSYLWVAVNYLLGNSGKKYTETVGVVDLGGASVQMTYAVSNFTAQNAPKPPKGEAKYIKEVVLKGKEYKLYVHSYLGYGRNEAREKILNATNGSANPCMLHGFDGIYTHAGADYKAYAPNYGSNFDECREIVLKVLRVNDKCPHPNCTFSGIWDGGRGSGQKNLLITSSFYKRAIQVGIADPKKPSSIARPVDWEIAAKQACKVQYKDAKSLYPGVKKSKHKYLCLDLTYQYSLLVDGFGLNPQQNITVANGTEYKDGIVATSWALGTAIETISSLDKFHPLMYFI